MLLLYNTADVDTGSPCIYDEGSPLVQDNNGTLYVVGIMSKNAGCGADFLPTIYTRTMPYYPWFKKLAGDQPVSKQFHKSLFCKQFQIPTRINEFNKRVL